MPLLFLLKRWTCAACAACAGGWLMEWIKRFDGFICFFRLVIECKVRAPIELIYLERFFRFPPSLNLALSLSSSRSPSLSFSPSLQHTHFIHISQLAQCIVHSAQYAGLHEFVAVVFKSKIISYYICDWPIWWAIDRRADTSLNEFHSMTSVCVCVFSPILITFITQKRKIPHQIDRFDLI